jgi:aminoglycoside phosphotransferase (APT) family kinase protein
VAVPEVLAAGDDAEPDFFWFLESFVDGQPFDHGGFARPEVRRAAADLGRHLRRLHEVEMQGTAAVPRWEWHPGRIERAARIARLDAAERARLDDVHAFLRQTAPAVPRLCKGDCAGANLLVRGDRIAAIIDWEWAFFGDPAGDVGAWHSRNADLNGLDHLLAGYQPDDEAGFCRRVAAHQVAGALEEIAVFSENVHVFDAGQREEGIRSRTRWLRDGLSRW